MEAAVGKTITDQLLALGLPGIIIIVLAYVTYKLAVKFNDVQEKRIAESRQTVEAMVTNTAALDTLSKAIDKRKDV